MARETKRGFTLIEVMVATTLLAMLVTILTMIFNQSSIAWTIGVASSTALGDMREEIAVRVQEADNALKADDGQTVYRVVSVFADGGTGLRSQGRTLSDQFVWMTDLRGKNLEDLPSERTYTIGGSTAQGHESYLVGVHSYGPDGKTGGNYSWDDISTMPEEVVR